MFWKKIKGFIIDITIDITKYMLILIVFMAILLVGVYMSLKNNNAHPRGWNEFEQHEINHPKGWNEFEQRVQKEYEFIKNIEIYSNETNIFIVNISNKNMDLVEAEDIFKETKSFLLSEDVFSSIEEYQKKKYPNDFHEICISFHDDKENRNLFYEFRSDRESDKGHENFNVWYMHIPGQDNDMVIEP